MFGGPGGVGAEKWPKPERRSAAKIAGDRRDRWDRWDGPDRSGGPVPMFSVDNLACFVISSGRPFAV